MELASNQLVRDLALQPHGVSFLTGMLGESLRKFVQEGDIVVGEQCVFLCLPRLAQAKIALLFGSGLIATSKKVVLEVILFVFVTLSGER
jgi:hypothetical protein